METNAAGGLLSVSDLVGLTRFKKMFVLPHIFPPGSSEDRLLHVTNPRLKPAFLISVSPLSAKQSLEGWHPSFICSFLLAMVHFIHSVTLIDNALSHKCHSCDTVLLEGWLWRCIRPWTIYWCGTSQWPAELLRGHCLAWMVSLHLL